SHSTSSGANATLGTAFNATSQGETIRLKVREAAISVPIRIPPTVVRPNPTRVSTNVTRAWVARYSGRFRSSSRTLPAPGSRTDRMSVNVVAAHQAPSTSPSVTSGSSTVALVFTPRRNRLLTVSGVADGTDIP